MLPQLVLLHRQHRVALFSVFYCHLTAKYTCKVYIAVIKLEHTYQSLYAPVR